jgi:hypothetical protein
MTVSDGMDTQLFALALGIRVFARIFAGRSAVKYFARSQKYQNSVRCESYDKFRININFFNYECKTELPNLVSVTIHSMFLLWCPRVWQFSWGIWADASCLRELSTALGVTTKEKNIHRC